MKLTYDISTLVPYINWVYFYHAWQLKQPVEQQKIKAEAEQFLMSLEHRYHAYALFHILDAHSAGDDIVLLPSNKHIPCLRQQGVAPCYSLADFIHPDQDKVGIFVTSVDKGMETDFDADPYQKMMAQLLADRLAEAAAELMHLQVRTHYWGYAADEHLSMAELHLEQFQGIRPAVGYHSLPDASINFLLDELLDMQQIGVSLTESGAMRPHASVSGLMISHPQARYFSIGRIGNDQLCDYAARRGMSVENIRKFLSANL